MTVYTEPPGVVTTPSRVLSLGGLDYDTDDGQGEVRRRADSPPTCSSPPALSGHGDPLLPTWTAVPSDRSLKALYEADPTLDGLVHDIAVQSTAGRADQGSQMAQARYRALPTRTLHRHGDGGARMRILAAHPGPNFSVHDVYVGWVEALRQLGVHVLDFNLADRLTFYDSVLLEKGGEVRKAMSPEQATNLAVAGHQRCAVQGAAGRAARRERVLLRR
jgi:hypothetical protein